MDIGPYRQDSRPEPLRRQKRNLAQSDFAVGRYSPVRMEAKSLGVLVDLAGIEPATSSMPWNSRNGKPLPVKYL